MSPALKNIKLVNYEDRVIIATVVLIEISRFFICILFRLYILGFTYI